MTSALFRAAWFLRRTARPLELRAYECRFKWTLDALAVLRAYGRL